MPATFPSLSSLLGTESDSESGGGKRRKGVVGSEMRKRRARNDWMRERIRVTVGKETVADWNSTGLEE